MPEAQAPAPAQDRAAAETAAAGEAARDQPRHPGTTATMLPAVLAAAVLAVPGVVRLEPTLSTVGPSLLLRKNATDGIRLVTRSATAEVDVSIATSSSWPARAVTHQVQATIADLLTSHNYQPGTITVTVLTITPATAA